MQLTPQPVHQSPILRGPLVLSKSPLKYRTPTADKDQQSCYFVTNFKMQISKFKMTMQNWKLLDGQGISACLCMSPCSSDYIFTLLSSSGLTRGSRTGFLRLGGWEWQKRDVERIVVEVIEVIFLIFEGVLFHCYRYHPCGRFVHHLYSQPLKRSKSEICPLISTLRSTISFSLLLPSPSLIFYSNLTCWLSAPSDFHFDK